MFNGLILAFIGGFIGCILAAKLVACLATFINVIEYFIGCNCNGLFVAEFAACLTTVGIGIDLNCNAVLAATVAATATTNDNENSGVLFTPNAIDGSEGEGERVVSVVGLLGVVTALLCATIGIERKREGERERVVGECFIVGICVFGGESDS